MVAHPGACIKARKKRTEARANARRKARRQGDYTKVKPITVLMAMFLCLAMAAQASTVNVTFLNSGVITNLAVNGYQVETICISDVPLGPPYTWIANEIPLPNTEEFLAGAWLFSQFDVSRDWMTIHKAMLDIFGASYADSATLGWVAQAQQPANYNSVNALLYRVLDPINSEDRTYIVWTPEPNTGIMLLVGVALMVAGVRRWSHS